MHEYRDDAYWDPFAECWVNCTKPVVVDGKNPPQIDPNVLYGDRYGVDWVYGVVPPQPPFDTVGELRQWLSTFDAATPLAAHYTGEGRVSGVPSFNDVDRIECVSLYRTLDAYLEAHAMPLHNPLPAAAG